MDLEGRLLIEQHIGDPSSMDLADAVETLDLACRLVRASSAVLEANRRLKVAGLLTPTKLALEIDHLGQVLARAKDG